MSTQQQGRTITAMVRNPNGKTVTARIEGKPSFNNIVLVGQKIISKEKDDPYVETCGKACAKKLGVEATKVSTGTEFILALEKASINEELSACVYWGHSWNVGLYLQNENGFYVDSYPYGSGSSQRRLSHLKASYIKLKPHSLFIFASCGTFGAGSYDDESFAVKFGDFIDLTKKGSLKEGLTQYKITIIGANDKSNLQMDGTAKCPDGHFFQIQKIFEIEKKAVYKEVEEGMWWWKETKKVFDRWETSTILIDSKLTKLGKVIDPTEIIKKHKPDDTSI